MKPIVRVGAAVVATLALLFAVMASVPGVQAQEPAAADVTLTILHNNDGESKLLPSVDDGFPGIARFVATLKALQAADTNDGVVTLTSGDNFLASKEFNASLEKGVPFFDSIALSGVYDAMALGNHDFDFGPDVAADFIEGFDPAIPFLSANADFSGEPRLAALEATGRIAASTIINVGGTQVGVIGAVTPKLPNISSPRGVVISADVAAVVNAEVAALEAQGVNKIVLISHLQDVNEDRALIPQLSGIDIAIAGGGDELLANPGDTCTLADATPVDGYPAIVADSDGNDVPLVTGPGGYRCIGRLEVGFTNAGELVSYSGGAIGVSLTSTADAGVLAAVEAPIQAAVADLQANIVGVSDVALDGRRASVRTMSSNEGSLLSDAIFDAATRLAPGFGESVPTVGIQNGGGIRNDSIIPAGNISEATTFDIAPFSNFVVVTEVSRERFKELLEAAVSSLPAAGGQFAQPSGFSMVVDIRNPARELDRDGDCGLAGDAGSRITDVTLDDGTQLVVDGVVQSGPPLQLATIDFLAGGGDCYPLGDLSFTRLGITYQQALAEYISGTLNGQISAASYPAAGTGRISVLDGYGSGQLPTPTPVPTPTATPGATATPTSVATPSATPSATAVASATAVPTTAATSVPTVAATSVPISTAAPAPTAVLLVPTSTAIASGSGAFGFGDTPPPKASSSVSPSAKKAAAGVTPTAAKPLAVTGSDSRPLVAYGFLLLVAGLGIATLGRRLRID